MSEVMKMARKPREVRYFKPYMGALSGWIGRSIIETILNTPKPDRTELNKKAEECRRAPLTEMEKRWKTLTHYAVVLPAVVLKKLVLKYQNI